MDIAEHRVPQEGRVSLSVSDRQIDLRLATLPSLYGETVRHAAPRQVGQHPHACPIWASSLTRSSATPRPTSHPYGVILVTGPTGAGKTTTLYATLQEVMSKEKSVVTVEDPVEYQIDGITQVQINQKAGLRLRHGAAVDPASRPRHRPDRRDPGHPTRPPSPWRRRSRGHLVLTTLHTNTAAATPLRLTEMGIEPFLVTRRSAACSPSGWPGCSASSARSPTRRRRRTSALPGTGRSDLEGVDTSTLYRAVGLPELQPHRVPGPDGAGRGACNMSEEIDRMIIEQQSIVEHRA